VFKKNISDGVGSQNGLNGTPLDPPLFWLDNIFNTLFLTRFRTYKIATPPQTKMISNDNI
jgi:hypothetical protein